MVPRRALLAAAAAAPGPAWSQPAWPSQPIRIVVPFGPAGATDIFARTMADRLSAALGQRAIVENRPGAGGALGAASVARAAPDGHTLLVITSSHTIGEALLPNRGYVLLRDFVPVAGFNTTALAIAATPSLPAPDLAGLVALARRAPGTLSYATTGIGTVNHLAAELLRAGSGIEWTHIPYRSGGEARNDLVAGRVPLMIDPVTNAAELARDGRVRVLGVTTAERSAALPEAPTVAEGGFPGFDVGILIGLVAPRGTPPGVVERLNAEIRRALPSLAASWRAQGAEPLDLPAAEWGTRLSEDVARWGEVVRSAGVRLE
jgi:tripartite-type tricarboxylate transporter receptor subunit TctC